MSIDERRRIRLFERWVQTWGQEDAETMLDLLPPPGRGVATSDDIAALDAKIDALQEDTRGQIAALRNVFDLKLDLKLDAATAELTAVFRSEIQRAIVTQTRITVFSMVTAFAAVSALALGLG